MGFGRRDIDRMMKMEKGVKPVDAAAGAQNGPAIDRRSSTGDGASAVLHVTIGDASGGPSTQSVIGKMQDSATGNSDWQDIGSATADMTGDDEDESTLNLNLVGIRRFIRGVVTVAFTGGSTPAIPIGATLCIGGRE